MARKAVLRIQDLLQFMDGHLISLETRSGYTNTSLINKLGKKDDLICA